MAKDPTAAQRKRWGNIVDLGCIVPSSHCMGRITIHHCCTGMGGRKNHDKVIGLCYEHHLGSLGIDGQRMSKREWQCRYGSEEDLLKQVSLKLGEENV